MNLLFVLDKSDYNKSIGKDDFFFKLDILQVLEYFPECCIKPFLLVAI